MIVALLPISTDKTIYKFLTKANANAHKMSLIAAAAALAGFVLPAEGIVARVAVEPIPNWGISEYCANLEPSHQRAGYKPTNY